MTFPEPSPPHWIDALLQSLLRPSDREAISGDLLEEYRAARLPRLGVRRANLWHLMHVLSVLWLMIWPFAVAVAAQSVFLAFTVFRPGHHTPHSSQAVHAAFVSRVLQVFWYGSVAGTPGLSLFDATIYFAAAYRAVQRTRLVRAGLFAATAISVIGSGVLFATAAAITPGLILAVARNPLLVLILSVTVGLPLVYSIIWAFLGGLLARVIPADRRQARSS